LSKELLDLSHGCDFFNLFLVSFQEGLRDFLDLVLLLRSVGVILNSASAGEGIVHLELLLELSYFSLVPL
jgi:hypothetical protein